MHKSGNRLAVLSAGSPIIHNRDAVHHTPVWKIVACRKVHRAAVVPHGDRIVGPLEADLEGRLIHMIE